jgi:hypothetical protein
MNGDAPQDPAALNAATGTTMATPEPQAQTNNNILMSFLTTLKDRMTGVETAVTLQGTRMGAMEARLAIAQGGIQTGPRQPYFGTPGTQQETPNIGRPRSLFETLMRALPRGRQSLQERQDALSLTPVPDPSPADTAGAANSNAAVAVSMAHKNASRAKPPIINQTMLDNYKNRPEILMSNFNLIIHYVTHSCVDKAGPCLDDLVQFFHDEAGLWFGQFTATHGLEARGPEVMTDLRMAFQSRFTGEVRAEEYIALDQLLNREIVQQQGESVAKYSERFLTVARKLPNESEVSLCRHYVRGLLPHLAERCCVDREDNEWSSLSALVKCSLSQDLRVQTVRQLRALHAPSNPGARNRSFHKHHGTRTPQGQQEQAHVAMDVTPDATAAPVVSGNEPQGRMTQAENPYLDGRPRDWETVPKYIHVKNEAMNVPAGLRPPKECPAYDCEGQLKDRIRERTLLSAWYLCPFCRKERHSPENCAKAQKAEANKRAKKRQAEGGSGPAKKK